MVDRCDRRAAGNPAGTAVPALVIFMCALLLLGLNEQARAGNGRSAYAPLDRSGPTLSVPKSALRETLRCSPDVRDAKRDPVLLSPGTGNTAKGQYGSSWQPALSELGVPWCSLSPPHQTLGDIQTTGEYLVRAIRLMHRRSGRRIAILGHSQGGMSMRWALRFWPGTRPMVSDVIGLAANNHGSRWQLTTNVKACNEACPPVNYQQAKGSNFLAALNSRAETFKAVSYTQIYTDHDLILDNTAPACASCLRTGEGLRTNVSIQSICPADESDHVALASDLVTYHLVLDALNHRGPAKPSRIPRSICDRLLDRQANPLTAHVDPSRPKDVSGLLAVVCGKPCDTTGAPHVTSEPALRRYVFKDRKGPDRPGAVKRIGRSGRWFTDGRGRKLVMHGTNMVNKLPPYAPDATGFGADDAAFLKRQGMNSVRVGIALKAVEPQPGIYDDTYLARIERTVRILDRHGISSLLDFHQDMFNERFEGGGWPDWAVQDDGLPSEPRLGFPVNYVAMPALQRAFDNFWANSPGPLGVGLQDHYAMAWRHVAERFRTVPGVLGYDLMNEPFPGTNFRPCLDRELGCPDFDATLTAFTTRVVDAIRRVDRRTMVFYEPNTFFNGARPTNLGDIGDPRAALSFHDYLRCTPPNCIEPDPVIGLALAHVAKTGDALLMTEFGATDDVATLDRLTGEADRAMIGWQEWHYCDCDDPTTSGVDGSQAMVTDPALPPTGTNLRTTTLNALVRPYPQAIAGKPKGWEFDPADRRFAFTYEPTRGARRITRVSVPRRAFRGGYRAESSGAEIVSAAGATNLLLRSCRGARSVTLTVRPGPDGLESGCARPAALPPREPAG